MNKVWSFNAVLTFDATLESERVFGIFRRFMKVASYINYRLTPCQQPTTPITEYSLTLCIIRFIHPHLSLVPSLKDTLSS